MTYAIFIKKSIGGRMTNEMKTEDLIGCERKKEGQMHYL